LCSLEQVMGNDDLPYTYGERANLGILAVATTKAGYIPLEEYSADKGRGKHSRVGRADLWLTNKKGNKAFDFEAKCIRLSIRPKHLIDTIQNILKTACEDANDIRNKSQYNIGIVFICLYGANNENFKSDINKFWVQLRDRRSYEADFCALHICQTWSKNEHGDCPGIAVIGRYI
ncbi:MAG: hypothetical protein Q8Q15_03780, partial [bacterium]|nr:hypothetical protein [bacterium]